MQSELHVRSSFSGLRLQVLLKSTENYAMRRLVTHCSGGPRSGEACTGGHPSRSQVTQAKGRVW